jgi:hypothetical protein
LIRTPKIKLKYINFRIKRFKKTMKIPIGDGFAFVYGLNKIQNGENE